MESYKKAKRLYSENKFESALECFKRALEKEQLKESEKILCLAEVIKIQKILSKNAVAGETERELANFLIEAKEYNKAIGLLEELVKVKKTYSISFKLIKTYLQSGDLFKAEKEAVSLLKYLFLRKNFEKTKKLYEFSKNHFPSNKKIESFMCLSLIQQGNIGELDHGTEDMDMDVLYEAFLLASYKHWRHSKVFFKTICNQGFGSELKNSNKKSLKLFLEKILLGEIIKREYIEVAMRYFKKNERKSISRLLCLYAEARSMNLDEKIINQIDSLPEDEEVKTDYDLGGDLLEQEEQNNNQIEKLIREMKLLEMMGEGSGVLLLRSKLKKIDPSHEMLIENCTGSRVATKRFDSSDLKEQWSELYESDERDDNKLAIEAKALLSSITDVEIEKNFSDLIICFNTMEFYEVSMQIIKRLEILKDIEKFEDHLEYYYFKVKTLIGLKKYFEAYDLVTEINGLAPLNGEERIEFLYLQGEIARKLGRVKDAIKSYLLVKKINPKYRLVTQRLQSFG